MSKTMNKYSWLKKAALTLFSMAVFAVIWQGEVRTVFAADPPIVVMVDGLNYNILKAPSGTGNGEVEVGDNGSYTASNLSIPATITVADGSGNDGTYDVVRIGECAFVNNRNLTGTLTIPSSVTSIEFAAFTGCVNLTGDLTIPDSVTTIGNSAFASCVNLTGTLTIPDSVTSVGTRAFDIGSTPFTRIDTDISNAAILVNAFRASTIGSTLLTCPTSAVEGYISLGFTDSNITRRLTISDSHIGGVTKTYDGTTAAALTVSGFSVYQNEDVTVTVAGAFDSADLGDRTVTITNTSWTLSGSDSSKYVLPKAGKLPLRLNGRINRSDALSVKTQPTANATEGVKDSYTFDMNSIELSKTDIGEKSYVAAITIDSNNILSNIQVSGSTLTYDVADTAKAGDTAAITITIQTPSYNDIKATLTITIIEGEGKEKEDTEKENTEKEVKPEPYVLFNQETINIFESAKEGEHIALKTDIWCSFPGYVMDTIKARRDLTIDITYKYNDVWYQTIIPAGAEVPVDVPYAGFYGYLGGMYGRTVID